MRVQCGICPKACVLGPGQSGECRIRMNLDGRLTALTYGFPCAIHIDPMEKKPLFHFLPGTTILSLATVGCNLHCLNCQNWEISQRNPEDSSAVHLPPGRIVELARQHACPSLAFTYTEPIVYYEYTLQTAIAAREAGMRNVLVTAGYASPAPWRELCRHVDAANIDLKAMSDRFYRDYCSASLRPVLRSLVAAREAGLLVEVTNLVIPGLNDADRDIEALSRWIVSNLGAGTPVHFSRFFPHYRMRHVPPTPPGTLLKARAIAREGGLHHVYIGNLQTADGEHTRCPACGGLCIARQRYVIVENRLRNGCCPDCGREIHGQWT